MKKLIFLIHFANIKRSSGIIQKVIAQSMNMQKEGFLYKTYILCRETHLEDAKQFEVPECIEFVPLPFYKDEKNIIKKFFMAEKVYSSYIKICEKEKNNFDYIYVRYNPLFFMFIKFALKFRKKIIFEHNSMEMDEYKGNKSKINIIRTILFDKLVRSCAKGFVAVTSQVFEYQKKKYKKVPGIIILNGIDVNKYPLRKAPKYDGENLIILFVGNIRYWHGLERIIESIADYKGNVNIKLNICGLFNQEDYLTPLVKKLNLEDKVNFLGYKNTEELSAEFDKAHVAIGCLGIYKIKVENVAILKNREYTSRGIPIISSGYDEEITPKYDGLYYYKLPNDDSKIDMNNIIQFVEKVYKKDGDVVAKELRQFAIENLDYSIKILSLKQLINEIK